MKFKQKHYAASDAYRIDLHKRNGEILDWFYGEQFGTQALAEKYIDERNPKYRDRLHIVKFHIPAHDALVSTMRF